MTNEQVLVLIPAQKSSYNADFSIERPLNFIGELLEFKQSQKFQLNGCEVSVPALTENNDQKMRTFSVLMQLTKAVFGEMEADAIAEPDSVPATFVDALRKSGYLISHNSKAAAREGVRIWLEGKKQAIKNQVLATRQLNVEKIARLIANQKENKTLQNRIKSDVEKTLS